MKKKIGIITAILAIIILVGYGVSGFIEDAKNEINPYSKLEVISVEDMFEEDGHFYVYFYKDGCKFCDNIAGGIKNLSLNSKVYVNNTNQMKDSKDYDWNIHEQKYDVEIGQKKDDGTMEYYKGYTTEEIEEKYPYLEYDILLADEEYELLHEGKEKGKVYAICTQPMLEASDLKKENFVVPAVPFLVEIDNHEVIHYYFDDKQIIQFLKLDTKPINSYWNID